MDSSTKNFREIDTLQLSDTIVTISASQSCFLAGTLDDTINVWKHSNEKIQKNPIFSWNNSATGIIDAKFNQNSTYVSATFMDSKIRQWELQTQKMMNIQCGVMSSWKLEYLNDSIVTCGDVGRVNFYNPLTGQNIRKLEAGDVHLTSISKTNDEHFLAVGSNNGNCYVLNLEKKDKMVCLKPHFKLLRSLSFTEDSSKLLTASDDGTIKALDIASQKVISSLEGHKEAVSCVRSHPHDSRIAYSCSFDKSMRCWDLRMKSCVGSISTGCALWGCEVIGKRVVCGGENGILWIYSVE